MARRILTFMAICLIPAIAWAENKPDSAQPRVKLDLVDLASQCEALKPPQSPPVCKAAVARMAKASAKLEAEWTNGNYLAASLALDAAEADFKKDFPDLWRKRIALK